MVTSSLFLYFFSPQIVKERMFCHAIIGTSTGKERIMRVDISAEFISPLLSFSQREINFCVMKVSQLNLKQNCYHSMGRIVCFCVPDVFVFCNNCRPCFVLPARVNRKPRPEEKLNVPNSLNNEVAST